jgi:DNA polymerase-3 subunit alpha (Gram-positive type)
MPFDYKFLAATAEKVNLKFNPYTVDTLTLSRKAFKDIENHKLQTLAKELNIPVSQAHRSESDAIVCGYLLQKCILKLNETKPRAKATANK